MATFKHISSKNADYGAAEQYLTFEHDEFTMKPTLDGNGQIIPRTLKEFIDKCHQNNIGVLLDFVPVHFAVDDYALANFDGTPLYEYPHTDVGYSEWGSKNFNHSRGEVQSFLQSNANYWIKE